MKDIKNINIGFIGFGNMAQAMADGFLSRKVLAGEQIYACAGHFEKLQVNAASRGIHACEDASAVVQASDIVIIAVKPYMIETVLAPVLDLLKDKIMISVAAGWSFDKYEALLKPGTHHLSIMPNTPVAIGEGVIVSEATHSLTNEEYAVVEKLLSGIAVVQAVESEHMGIAGTVAGCGPAFVSMFIEALADAGVKHGLKRDVAYRLVSQMTAGTGKLQIATGNHPGVMKDAVCSPGGTTIRGVAELERRGMRGAVIDAIDAIEG